MFCSVYYQTRLKNFEMHFNIFYFLFFILFFYNFFTFKEATHAYLLKATITHNEKILFIIFT